MTPDRRLDQLEPLMADSLQKIDRLIEGQGQLVELATNTKTELEQVKKTGELTANGLANLTVSTQKQFDELRAGQEELRLNQEELKTNQDRLSANQEDFKISLYGLKANQEGFRDSLDGLKANQEEFRINQEDFKTDLDGLKASQEELKATQEKLMVGQELILQILREKLP